MPDQHWTTIALLARPWGNRGELLADPLTDSPDRFQQLTLLHLARPGAAGDPHPVRLDSARPYRGRIILKLRGVDCIAAAQALAGAQLLIPTDRRPQPPPGRFYQDDLLGCQVLDRRSGRTIGVVTDWLDTPGVGLLQVAALNGGHEILIPFARSLCPDINPQARRILVDLPDGLEDLNRP